MDDNAMGKKYLIVHCYLVKIFADLLMHARCDDVLFCTQFLTEEVAILNHLVHCGTVL